MSKRSAAQTKPARKTVRLPDLNDSLRKACKETKSPSQIEELRAAKRYIAEKNLPPDRARKAFDRAADAITNGIRVFISYKFIHHDMAARFRDLVRTYGHSRLAKDRDDQPYVFMAEQGVEAGKDYRRQILEEIDKAHWFFLLLPDIQLDREWPIYEAGYFQRGMTEAERLICVHHETVEAAAQFQYLQAYDSSPKELRRLFNQLSSRTRQFRG